METTRMMVVMKMKRWLVHEQFMVSVSHCKASRRSGYKNIASDLRPYFRKMSRLSCRISMFIDEQITSSQYQS